MTNPGMDALAPSHSPQQKRQLDRAEVFELDLPTPATRPSQLAVSAWVHGGPRAAVEKIRVLELGAGAGANLLPLAFYDPEGRYLGLDADPERVERARSAAEALGLTNARFEVVDWSAPPTELGGPFDFVLVRDLFAHVPEAARVGLLSLCRAQLASEGLVYLDYPVAPGGTHQALVRELLRSSAGSEGGAAAQAEQARRKAGALRALLGPSEHPYPNLLARELTKAAEMSSIELGGEYLSGSPAVFFHRDVVERAALHGLRFVCDAEFNRPQGYAPDALREELARAGLRGVDLEQALDIFCHRSTRASVFCRAELDAASLPGPEALDHLLIASPLAPVSDAPSLGDGEEETFTGPFGQRIGSVDPLLKASLSALQEAWPKPVSFGELMGRAVEILHHSGAEGVPSDEQLAGVAKDLWTLYRRGLVELSAAAPTLPSRRGRTLHALGRLEAKTRTALTTPLHTLLPLQGFEAALVRRMDPGVGEDALVSALVASIAQGEVPLELGGTRLTDRLLLEPVVRGLLNRALVTLGRWGLLEAEREGES